MERSIPHIRNIFSVPRKKSETQDLCQRKAFKEENTNSRKGSSRNYNTYTSKTLTEQDMKHLERHLSMKKTIRKQISRNLAQAFLENPDIFEPDAIKTEAHKQDHVVPEQNVLDLLKVSLEERDSGHSSPAHDTDTDYEEDDWKPKTHCETKGLMGSTEKKSSSLWKKLTSRTKVRR